MMHRPKAKPAFLTNLGCEVTINTKQDKLYCGVRADVIAKANPVLDTNIMQHHWNWIRERYAIHVNKDILRRPAPWTQDPILQQVKFCNLFREDDRQSRNLIEHIANRTEYSLKDRCFNIILFRLWNKLESFERATGGKLLKFPLSAADYATVQANIARCMEEEPDYAWYSAAYNTAPIRNWLLNVHCGGKKDAPVYPVAPLEFCKACLDDVLWSKLQAATQQDQVVAVLSEFPYVGGKFLTYQLFVDFTYCPDYHFTEHEYTVSGPGCIEGLNLLFVDRDGMTHDEALFWLRNNFQRLYGPLGYDPATMFKYEPHKHINVMCLENTFCELGKMHRCTQLVKEGKKPRGKASYNGQGSKTMDLFSI